MTRGVALSPPPPTPAALQSLSGARPLPSPLAPPPPVKNDRLFASPFAAALGGYCSTPRLADAAAALSSQPLMMRRPDGHSAARGGDRTKCRAMAAPPLPRLLRLASQCGAPWLCVAGRARRERCRWRRTQNEMRNTFARLAPTRAREACGGCATAFGFGHCCIRKWRRVRAAAVLPTERHLGETGGRKS